MDIKSIIIAVKLILFLKFLKFQIRQLEKFHKIIFMKSYLQDCYWKIYIESEFEGNLDGPIVFMGEECLKVKIFNITQLKGKCNGKSGLTFVIIICIGKMIFPRQY